MLCTSCVTGKFCKDSRLSSFPCIVYIHLKPNGIHKRTINLGQHCTVIVIFSSNSSSCSGQGRSVHTEAIKVDTRTRAASQCADRASLIIDYRPRIQVTRLILYTGLHRAIIMFESTHTLLLGGCIDFQNVIWFLAFSLSSSAIKLVNCLFGLTTLPYKMTY